MARIAGIFLSSEGQTHLPWLMQLNFFPPRGLIFAKDAAQFVLMMKFRAANRVLQAQIHSGGGQHPQRRREKVNPQRIPKLRQYGAAKRARWIHAHAGDRRFKRDEYRQARASKQSGEARELLRIRND